LGSTVARVYSPASSSAIFATAPHRWSCVAVVYQTRVHWLFYWFLARLSQDQNSCNCLLFLKKGHFFCWSSFKNSVYPSQDVSSWILDHSSIAFKNSQIYYRFCLIASRNQLRSSSKLETALKAYWCSPYKNSSDRRTSSDQDSSRC
jgi:hypothetical protein